MRLWAISSYLRLSRPESVPSTDTRIQRKTHAPSIIGILLSIALFAWPPINGVRSYLYYRQHPSEEIITITQGKFAFLLNQTRRASEASAFELWYDGCMMGLTHVCVGIAASFISVILFLIVLSLIFALGQLISKAIAYLFLDRISHPKTSPFASFGAIIGALGAVIDIITKIFF